MPKGWTEITLEVQYSHARRGFDRAGRSRTLAIPWTTWTSTAGLRTGLAPGWEVFATIPVVHSSARVDQLGFGTATIGTRIGTFSLAPHRSIAVELRGRMPLGYPGGSLTHARLPLSTGTIDVVLGVQARFGWKGLVFDGRIEGWKRFGARVPWSTVPFRPGDELHGLGSIRVQAGPLIFGPEGKAVGRNPASLGGEKQQGSGGWELQGGASVGVEISRAVQLIGRGSQVVLGQDATYAWLPDVHPVRRRTLGIEARVRW